MSESNTNTKADALIRRIEDALQNLVTLRVVTAVTPLRAVAFTADGTPTTDPSMMKQWNLLPTGEAANGMVTEINLIEGDIRNAMSPDFGGEDRKSLREFHLQQVSQSRTIVHDNIQAVLDLARSLRSST
jgi:hypothetical protein